MIRIIFLIIFFYTLNLNAEKISIFVASSASKAMSEIKEEFLKKYPNNEIELVFGASGKYYQLLKQGREFDLFFSADEKYALEIQKDNNALTPPKIYALGVVVFYFLNEDLLKDGIQNLDKEKIKHLSIANPKLAPYGVASIEILKNLNLYDAFKDKIILSDNISQPVMHVDSGVADIALVAYSLVFKDPKGKVAFIDNKLYTHLKQSFVITKYAKNKELAFKFSDFVLCNEGKMIIKKYGFNTL